MKARYAKEFVERRIAGSLSDLTDVVERLAVAFDAYRGLEPAWVVSCDEILRWWGCGRSGVWTYYEAARELRVQVVARSVERGWFLETGAVYLRGATLWGSRPRSFDDPWLEEKFDPVDDWVDRNEPTIVLELRAVIELHRPQVFKALCSP